MALSAVQLGLCFQSYWYMWLTNGLSGLLFIGIDIGIAAFFLKKFNGQKKPSTYKRPDSGPQRPFSATNIKDIDGVESRATSRNQTTLSNDSSTASENEDFAHTTCAAINSVRRQYGAPPLEVNDQLSDIAQRWANEMARTGKLEHSPAELRNYGRQTLGENFTARFQRELTPDKMVKTWLKEGRKYNFGSNGSRDTENFTQMVWRSTQEIGVGRARSEDGNWWYGVAVFDPPGNIPNQFTNNVLFPKD